MTQRSAELETALARVRARVAAACAEHGRDPHELTLVVVTKTCPVSDIAVLADLGVTDIGEARDGEGAQKRQALGDRPLRWHCIGQVQTKKAGSVSRWADVVHSADREKLVLALGRGAEATGRTLDVLVQVNLQLAASAPAADPAADPAGGPPPGGRGGAEPSAVPGLVDTVARTPGLRAAGLMAVAPLGADPRASFDRLRALADVVRASHRGARWISAGMSGDLEAAVAAGATHLRVGSAVLGSRPALR